MIHIRSGLRRFSSKIQSTWSHMYHNGSWHRYIAQELPKSVCRALPYRYRYCKYGSITPEGYFSSGMKLSKIIMSKKSLFFSSCSWLLIVQAAVKTPKSLLHILSEMQSEYLWLNAIKSGLPKILNKRFVRAKYKAPLNSSGLSLWKASESCPLNISGLCLLYQ